MATRRGILKGALILGGAWAIMARPWTWFSGAAVEVAPLDGLAPFRRLVTAGSVSGQSGAAQIALIGLDTPEPTDPTLAARVRAEVRDLILGEWTGGLPVPVTYFTDIQCPVCRELEARLATLDGITLTTREFPVFGEASERAARAILAAEFQGAAEVLRQRFQRAPSYRTQAALEALLTGLPAPTAQVLSDMEGPAVAARLAEDRALARLFRLPGTPGVVIGRTLMIGLQPAETLRAIVEMEREGL